MRAEQLKYGPKVVCEIISDILNVAAKTGEYKNGLLTPLQKPGKKCGPCTNLRPIILLPILRKTLAICLLQRTTDRLMRNLPNSQAAY